MAILNQLFYSLRFSSLVPQRLSSTMLRVVRSLNIAAVPSSRRGMRGGKSAKIARARSRFLFCGLANARSLVSNKHLFNYHITVTGLDLLAITETWLNDDIGDVILRDVCPAGYSAIHCPRASGREEGIALLFRDSIRVNGLNVDFKPASFEYLPASLSVNGNTICLVVIYRSPSLSPSLFLTEFADLLELLLPTPSKLLIVGDFNIHVDTKSNLVCQKFLSFLESCDLLQHVSGPTHISGHTLDLVISRSVDSLVLNCDVFDPLSDHYAVHWLANASRPVRPKKTVSLRNLKAIDMDRFATDLLCLPLLTDETDDIARLLDLYNAGLTEVLDKHAPL
jgi:hypothetical protein